MDNPSLPAVSKPSPSNGAEQLVQSVVGPTWVGAAGEVHAQWGNPQSPPLNDDHIHKLIDLDKDDAGRNHFLNCAKLVVGVVVLILVLAFVLVVLQMLGEKNPQLAEKIIIGTLAFAAGVLAGFGGCKAIGRSKAD